MTTSIPSSNPPAPHPVRPDADDAAFECRHYARCRLPTAHGNFAVDVYRLLNEEEALLISMGHLDVAEPTFVRVHSECFTGEVLGSLKCDCRPQLESALAEIARRGRGAIVYLRQEGRGIGLGNKIRAYAEQDKGADTIQANHLLGFASDLRDFRAAAEILRLHGIRSVLLNTNNPDKIATLAQHGLAISEVVPSITPANEHNIDYLRTKAESLGHQQLGHVIDPPRPTAEGS